MQGRRAFTLVEILLSIGILGMIMVAIYASWNAILRGSKAGLEAAADAQRGRIAISRAIMSTISASANAPRCQ